MSVARRSSMEELACESWTRVTSWPRRLYSTSPVLIVSSSSFSSIFTSLSADTRFQ